MQVGMIRCYCGMLTRGSSKPHSQDIRTGFTVWCFSPDGTTLTGVSNTEVWLWDADTGQLKTTLTGHTDGVYSVVFSPDGRTLASGGDREVRLWDARTGGHQTTLTGHTDEVYSVAFSPDGRTLASGGDKEVRLWEARTGGHQATLKGHTGWIGSIAFSPEGRTLADASYKEVRLSDADTGQLKATFRGHRDHVESVVFSPDGKTLASVSEDGTVLLWDMSPYLTPIALAEVPAWDVNEDGIVNILDLVTTHEQFGQKGDQLSGDVNDDGIVNILDLVTVSAHLSATTTPKAPAVPSVVPVPCRNDSGMDRYGARSR